MLHLLINSIWYTESVIIYYKLIHLPPKSIIFLCSRESNMYITKIACFFNSSSGM
jgi:hypothetical protein